MDKNMKKNMPIMLTALTILLLANFQLPAIQQQAEKSFLKEIFLRKQFCLSGGLSMFGVNGKGNDYMAGTNDFPVTPAYQSPAFGLSFAVFMSRSFAVGIDVRYSLSAKVDLHDPSDGETIQVDTPKNLIAAVSLFQYFKLSKRAQLFISLGGGTEYRLAEDMEYVSALGSEISISAPAKPLSPLAAAGIGLQYMFSTALGINLECRATYVFRDPAQILFSPVLALVLKF
jgi:hypothetical protein